MTQRELRSFTAELRAEPGQPRKIIGYAAVFNSPSVDLGGFVEVMRPECFAKALADAGFNCICNIDHDNGQMLGRSKSGTLRVEEDDHGLRIECDLPDTTYANNLVELMGRKDYSQMSFAFVPLKEQWSEKNGTPVREVLECDLLDVSVVVDACYEATEVALRSFEQFKASRGTPRLNNAKRLLALHEKYFLPDR